MAFNDNNEEVFNFGKHKGKRVEDVFNLEPSYYSWMMNGDFPLYTKRKLEQIYKRWNDKRQADRQQKATQPKPVENIEKKDTVTPNIQKDLFQQPVQQKTYNKPYENKPFKKKEEPAAPVNEDMLKLLADKFKKGL